MAALTLKIATVCMLLLLVGSDLARPAVCLASSSSSPDDGDQEATAAGGSLLRELLALEREELTQKLSLLAEQHGGVGQDVCTPACQDCLIICAIMCVFTANPATCFANCTLANGCFSKALLPVA